MCEDLNIVEVEHLPIEIDLKRLLMELGNNLVQRHLYEPAASDCELTEPDIDAEYGNTTTPLYLLTAWLNTSPEAREELAKLGFKWSMPDA